MKNKTESAVSNNQPADHRALTCMYLNTITGVSIIITIIIIIIIIINITSETGNNNK